MANYTVNVGKTIELSAVVNTNINPWGAVVNLIILLAFLLSFIVLQHFFIKLLEDWNNKKLRKKHFWKVIWSLFAIIIIIFYWGNIIKIHFGI